MDSKNNNNDIGLGSQRGIEIEKRLQKLEKIKPLLELSNTICLSRQIGVGALGIAEMLGQKLGYFVADRAPGKMNELMSKFFSLKSFGFKDYMQHLIAAIYTLAETGPTIFVGRGAYRIIPREYVLGVRLIASKQYRIKRMMHLYMLGEGLAEEKIDHMDREQKDFFKKAFGKTEPSSSEFDLVVNLDYFHDHQGVASVIEHAFRQKFGI
jgi:cytidylate kinase